MSDAGADRNRGDIALRDEVLELLYWFEGEGFHDHASVAGMTRFLACSESETAAAVARLVDRGDLVEADDSTYRLSATGRREAARRFADDFGPLLHQGHGECNDPDCDCHSEPSRTAAECRSRVAHSAHPRGT